MATFFLEITSALLNKMYTYASKTKNEVCGVLIGKKKDNTHFLISDVILDKNSINRSRYSVTRNTRKLYPTVKENVENSFDRGVDFIGDWHSHPNWIYAYSSCDLQAINKMINDPDYNFLDSIILIIIKPPTEKKGYIFLRSYQDPIETDFIITDQTPSR